MTPAKRRLGAAVTTTVVLAAGLIGLEGGAFAGPGTLPGTAATDLGDLRAAAEPPTESTPHVHDDSHAHPAGGDAELTHDEQHAAEASDPVAKNALSRGAEEAGAATADPTTARQADAARAAVAAQRTYADPPLTDTAVRRGHSLRPADRYEMAGACYTLRSGRTGRYLRPTSTGPAFLATRESGAQRFWFQATDLGSYLLYTAGGRHLGHASGAITYSARPSAATDWTVREPASGRFTFALPGRGSLAEGNGGQAILTATPTRMQLTRSTGCRTYPESWVGVTGAPHGGATSYQEVRGYVDAHTHGMAFEFLGGRVHCGRPWHRYGVAFALQDCPDHTLTGGKGAALESVLSGKASHDPVGWPTFKDWPAPRSLTHEGTYYKWMERSWRGGQRLLVNLLVENNKLCELYPLKKNSCDDMDSVRLQAKRMRELERYVDAQAGGPGRGWYRLVTSPEQARRVINAGKLAVVTGIETSVPFGCTMKLDVPQCDAATIERQLDEMHRLGVRQMELVNKFDNALSGIAGDEGQTGVAVNSANFLETGSFWSMATCTPEQTGGDPEVHDREQTTTPGNPAQDALFGAVYGVSGTPLQPLPLYPSPEHCNRRGLTELGEATIRGLAKRKMVFDPDHMSVKARQASMDLIERLRYPGVVSSHSWSTPDAYPRVYRAGGFITPYAGDSTGFVAKWRRHQTWADPRYYFGFGFGADINGLGAQGDPRGADVSNPVTYPFTGLAGVRISKQRTGQRTWDVNADGVSHYGLYPDWIEDLSKVAGSDAIVDDMARGAEGYLQMWERAEGIAPNACWNPGTERGVAAFTRLARGSTTTQVLRAVGQPDTRLGRSFTYCSADGRVRVSFDTAGRLTGVTRL